MFASYACVICMYRMRVRYVCVTRVCVPVRASVCRVFLSFAPVRQYSLFRLVDTCVCFRVPSQKPNFRVCVCTRASACWPFQVFHSVRYSRRRAFRIAARITAKLDQKEKLPDFRVSRNGELRAYNRRIPGEPANELPSRLFQRLLALLSAAESREVGNEKPRSL